MKWTNRGHEFDELGTLFQQNSDLYIWGAGAAAADFAVRAKALKLSLRLIDDSGRWRYTGWGGLDAVSPQQVLRSPEGKTVLVDLPPLESEAAFNRLSCVGFQRGQTCFSLDEFLGKWLSVYAVYVSGAVYFKDVCFIPSTKCNLNCECCLNFTPYLTQMKDEPIEQLKKQVDLFFTRVDYIGLFHVSGGEPILYPHLKELLIYLDQNYRGRIHQLATTTNGTLDFPDDICTVLREHHIFLICDDYTDALPQYRDHFSALLARLERNGVWHIANKVASWIDLAPTTTDNGCMCPEELESHFIACGIPFQEYYGGRLYSCNYAHFAEKANLSTCGEEDFLDFTALTEGYQKELVEFRLGYTTRGYVEFCKNCAGFFNNSNHRTPAVQASRRNTQS